MINAGFSAVVDNKKSLFGLRRYTMEEVISKMGFSSVTPVSDKTSRGSISTGNLAVCKIGRRFLMIGEPLESVLSADFPTGIIDNKLTAHLMFQSNPVGTHQLQYFSAGKAGRGHFIDEQKDVFWSRVFTKEDFPLPQSAHLDRAIAYLSGSLNIERRLFNRVFSGFTTEGINGFGWHPESRKWILCKFIRQDADENILQAMRLDDDEVTGEPFVAVESELQGGFLSHAMTYHMLQELVFKNLLGYRVVKGANWMESLLFHEFEVA